MLKKSVLCIVLILMATFSFAQSIQDFTLENETGIDIYFIYASPSSSDSWEEDILGDDILEYGDSLDVTFSGYDGVRYWDLMVEDSFGDEYYWEEIDLFTVATITLEMDLFGDLEATFD